LGGVANHMSPHQREGETRKYPFRKDVSIKKRGKRDLRPTTGLSRSSNPPSQRKRKKKEGHLEKQPLTLSRALSSSRQREGGEGTGGRAPGRGRLILNKTTLEREARPYHERKKESGKRKSHRHLVEASSESGSMLDQEGEKKDLRAEKKRNTPPSVSRGPGG